MTLAKPTWMEIYYQISHRALVNHHFINKFSSFFTIVSDSHCEHNVNKNNIAGLPQGWKMSEFKIGVKRLIFYRFDVEK